MNVQNVYHPKKFRRKSVAELSKVVKNNNLQQQVYKKEKAHRNSIPQIELGTPPGV